MTAKNVEKNSDWQLFQGKIADESGLAVIVADENSPALVKSNNNSICENLYNSNEFAPECEKYCGKAFKIAAEAGKTIGYKCYADLNCLAVPVKTENKQFVIITGRTFLKAEDYKKATKRAISGDWRQFQTSEFFENVLLSSSVQELETAAKRFENLSQAEKNALDKISEKEKAKGENESSDEERTEENQEEKNQNPRLDFENSQTSNCRAFLDSLTNLDYRTACLSILDFLAENFGAKDTAWLERRADNLQIEFSRQTLKKQLIQIAVSADDERLIETARRETFLHLRERRTGNENFPPSIVRLYPILLGGKIKAGLIIADARFDEKTNAGIVRFCSLAARELEIIKLRKELARRNWMAKAVRQFNEAVKDVDAENFWENLMKISADLVKSERGSLLVFNEKTNKFAAKAATGERAEIIKMEIENLGEKIALPVLQKGEPLIVKEFSEKNFVPAPVDRNYKTDSFISFPISIGERRVAVLNVTDKRGGEKYDDSDLEILSAIAPQIAVIIDRAGLKLRAGEFEQLSVTDALTGLLNRRYLEERLAEEIKRSHRHGFPMSFMMIDVDDFKSYNDNFSHPEGDRALQIVGQTLKETLRGADVAARYGGEEFSILLPQTTIDEAEAIGERIREKIEKTEFPKRKVTVSIGIAGCSQMNCTAQKLIAAADEALYEAKRNGRNNVKVFEFLRKNLVAETPRININN